MPDLVSRRITKFSKRHKLTTVYILRCFFFFTHYRKVKHRKKGFKIFPRVYRFSDYSEKTFLSCCSQLLISLQLNGKHLRNKSTRNRILKLANTTQTKGVTNCYLSLNCDICVFHLFCFVFVKSLPVCVTFSLHSGLGVFPVS